MKEYIHKKIQDYIIAEKVEEGLAYLFSELENSHYPNSNDIFILIINMNTLFGIYENQVIYCYYLENKKKLTNHSYFNILMWLTPIKAVDVIYEERYNGEAGFVNRYTEEVANHPGGLFFGFSPGPLANSEDNRALKQGLSLSDINATILGFTLPFKYNWPNDEYDMHQIINDHDGCEVTFFKVPNLASHPIFISNVHRQVQVSGNTIGHLIDIYPGQGEVTFVQIIIKENFQPEFDFKANADNPNARPLGIMSSNLREERALYGEDYLPSKIKALKIIKDGIADKSVFLNCKNEELTTDSFSYLRADFINYEREVILITRSFFFTSAKLFRKHSNRYIENIKKTGGLDSGFIDVFKSITIHKAADLKEFVILLFKEVITNKIHDKSGYAYLWHDDKCEISPKSEPAIQPYLFNLIETLCELKGVSVNREVATAQGQLDMLFTYTSPEARIFKVCVELKLAHHSHIDTAIKSQLTRYLDSQRTKTGIYLVLWFKYNDKNKFNKPTKYANIDKLRLAIEKNKPIGYDIDTMIIDCTRPISPSKQ